MILIPARFYSILAQVDLIAERPAIGALESELGNSEQATAELIREMERSIAEANRFIDSMK